MTKSVIVCMLLCSTVNLINAQGAKVLNAYNYMNDNELVKAKAEIEPAITNEKTMMDAKTWYYRGLIYENIYKNSFAENEKTKAPLYPELKEHRKGAVMTSVESFEKAIEIDSKKINMTEVKQHHAEMSKWCYQEGVNFYNEKNYGDAAKYFEKCYDIKLNYGQTDTLAIYNAGLSYKLAGDAVKAEELLRKSITLNYRAEQCYLDLLHMYSENGNKDKYKATLKEAREKMPNNKDIIQEEINVYLESKEYDKALVNLDQAIGIDPNNKALLYARGIILDNQQSTLREEGKDDPAKLAEADKAYARAEADYKKVIEIAPDDFDGNYSLGALYYNKGAEMLNEANNILDDAKYKAAKTKAEKQLTDALPYLEKAHKLKDTDIQTMQSLKVIYARTNQMDKFNVIKEKLEN